jgi:hypothetical protein
MAGEDLAELAAATRDYDAKSAGGRHVILIILSPFGRLRVFLREKIHAKPVEPQRKATLFLFRCVFDGY